MRTRMLVLAVTTACLLLPAAAFADGEPGGKIDPSVETVLEATGGTVAIPVMVEAPGALDQVRATIPLGVDITPIPIVDSLAAFLTPQEIATLGRAGFVTQIVADNPVHGLGDVELDERHQPRYRARRAGRLPATAARPATA